MLRQNFRQKLVQKLSPQQIQLMKLLQVPTAALEIRVKEEIETNPALEEGNEYDENEVGSNEDNYDEVEKEVKEDFELDDYIQDYIDDDPASYKLRIENNSLADEEDGRSPLIPVEDSFHEYLEQQLGLLDIKDERGLAIAEQIIGSIDNDGYLRRETIAIVDDLMFSQNIFATEEEVETILADVQQFDPPGVGARNLQECLILQIRYKLKTEKLSADDKELYYLQEEIIKNHFEEFSKKHYQKLRRHLRISENKLKEAVNMILKLNPKPASGTESNASQRTANYIVPDFVIGNHEGDLILSINARNAPELRINNQYKDMLSAYKDVKKARRTNKKEKEAVMFIKQKIDSAKWFIDAIMQRQQTMYKTMYAIMQHQTDFFRTGDPKKIRPMILKDIAEVTGLDISTISRVANSKYVQTEFGTKKLKYFFSESINTVFGEEVSSIEVKKILLDMIVAEDKKKPFSDEKLREMLYEDGYDIARRTVAKYREMLNLPVARLRKEI